MFKGRRQPIVIPTDEKSTLIVRHHLLAHFGPGVINTLGITCQESTTWTSALDVKLSVAGQSRSVLAKLPLGESGLEEIRFAAFLLLDLDEDEE